MSDDRIKPSEERQNVGSTQEEPFVAQGFASPGCEEGQEFEASREVF